MGWDRDPLTGYKAVYVPFQDGRPGGPPQDVVTGFLSPDERARGRPVGLALDRTGIVRPTSETACVLETVRARRQ